MPLTSSLHYLMGVALLLTSVNTGLAQDILQGDSVSMTPRYRLKYQVLETQFGLQRVYDDFLSPLLYQGVKMQTRHICEEPLQQSHPEWMMRRERYLGAAMLLNPAHSGAMTSIDGGIHWSILHRWLLPWGIPLAVGPGLLIEGGVLNSLRNQNNNMDILANGDLTGSLLVGYRIQWGCFVSDLRLHLSAAVVGLGFSPEYNATYMQTVVYESPLRHLSLHGLGIRHRYSLETSLDIPLGHITTLHLSYNYLHGARWVNHLYRSLSGHYMGIGISTHLRLFQGKEEIKNPSYTSPLFD